MKTEDLKKAVEIILKNGSPMVSFNVPVTDSCLNTYNILIHKSNASLINELVKSGFSLSMCNKGLIVDKY
jgi:hypothetical protein